MAGAANELATIHANPGAIGLGERYLMGATGRLGQDLDNGWGVSILDANTSVIALGLSFFRSVSDPPLTTADLPGWTTTGADEPTNRHRDNNLTLSVAYPLLDRRLSLGIGGTLSVYQHDLAGNGVDGNLDVGIGARPHDLVTIGLAGRNLIPIPGQEDFRAGLLLGSRVADEEVGYFGLDIEWFAEDAGVPIAVRTGGGLLVSENVEVQLGYRYEGPTDVHWLSSGVEVQNETAAIGYSLAMPLGDGKLRIGSFVHSLGIRVFVR